MPQWTRETRWRQGSVLTDDAARELGLVWSEAPALTCVMVISHDCDLANDNLASEPGVEVIVGRLVDSADGNFEWGKAPRTLHLKAQRDGSDLFIELVTTNKQFIAKTALATFEPDTSFSLNADGLSVLRSWLSSRYNRAAFADAFVGRMKLTEADRRLAKALRDFGNNISFVYFRLNGGNVERSEGDPYTLDVVLVFPGGEDAEVAQDQAEQAVKKVDAVLRARFKDPAVIILRSCIALSEEDITVAQTRGLLQWRLEYMTLSAADEQPGPPAG